MAAKCCGENDSASNIWKFGSSTYFTCSLFDSWLLCLCFWECLHRWRWLHSPIFSHFFFPLTLSLISVIWIRLMGFFPIQEKVNKLFSSRSYSNCVCVLIELAIRIMCLNVNKLKWSSWSESIDLCFSLKSAFSLCI